MWLSHFKIRKAAITYGISSRKFSGIFNLYMVHVAYHRSWTRIPLISPPHRRSSSNVRVLVISVDSHAGITTIGAGTDESDVRREGRQSLVAAVSFESEVCVLTIRCLEMADFGLAHDREQETALKLSSRSIAGREKTVEFVITNVSGSENRV
jgi:hypothetical protein